MLENKEHVNRDYSKFDTMSTEVLNEILYQDSQLPNDDKSDVDAILYILEVLNKREKNKSTVEFTNVDDAWKLFNEKYRSVSNDDQSLYDFNDDLSPIELQDSKSDKSSYRQHRMYKKRNSFRVACIAAVIIVVTLSGSFSLYALGYDIWGAVAKWTKDVFGFTTVADSDDIIKATDLLDEYGISEKLLPVWFPDEYQFDSSKVAQTPKSTTFHLKYVLNDSEILIAIHVLSEPNMTIYEKDNNNIIEYEAGGIIHYIMSNNDVTNIVWRRDNYECSIIGKIDVTSAKKMIKSIYRSN